MYPFIWATAGGFVARTLDNPLRPFDNIIESVGYAGLFATRPGQVLVLGVGSRVLSLGGSAATAVFGSTAVGVTLGAAGGLVIGAAVGTAISSAAFGPEGKQKAIEFYTGQNTEIIDYIPHYNAYKIIKHYVSNGGE